MERWNSSEYQTVVTDAARSRGPAKAARLPGRGRTALLAALIAAHLGATQLSFGQVGACCDHSPGAAGPGPEGACTDGVASTECAGTQQTWHDSQLCADVSCLETLGACCDLISGTCADDAVAADCPPGSPGTLNQHAWTKGATCAAVEAAGDCDAEIGACCDAAPFGACTDTTYAGCQCAQCTWTKLATCASLSPPCTHTAIPTMSQWGLAVLTLLLITAAKIYFGRRTSPATA